MKITIPSFPILTSDLKEKCKCKVGEYNFSYKSQNDKNSLTLKPISVASSQNIQAFNLIDERGEWDSTQFDAHVESIITVDQPTALFGAEGLVAHDAILGVAVMILSLSSNHRYSVPVMKIYNNSDNVSSVFGIEIPRNFYRDKISFRTVFYLYEPGHPSIEEVNMADLPGTVLGIIDEIVVYIDGTGSLFPVKKESDPSKPLWRVECDWSDPYNDFFNEENVCVIFNQAHPNYGLLKIEEGMNGSPFLSDVIASALHIIITKTIESVGSAEELDNLDAAVPGSIVDAVHYFISTFGWDPSSPERLAETIRLDFDRRTGNDR